jgi:hypothetical protein
MKFILTICILTLSFSLIASKYFLIDSDPQKIIDFPEWDLASSIRLRRPFDNNGVAINSFTIHDQSIFSYNLDETKDYIVEFNGNYDVLQYKHLMFNVISRNILNQIISYFMEIGLNIIFEFKDNYLFSVGFERNIPYPVEKRKDILDRFNSILNQFDTYLEQKKSLLKVCRSDYNSKGLLNKTALIETIDKIYKLKATFLDESKLVPTFPEPDQSTNLALYETLIRHAGTDYFNKDDYGEYEVTENDLRGITDRAIHRPQKRKTRKDKDKDKDKEKKKNIQ